MNTDKIKKLKAILETLNDGLSRDEFVASFKAVFEQVKKVEADLIKTIDSRLEKADKEILHTTSILKELKQEFEQTIKETKEVNETTFANVKKRTIEAIDSLFMKMRFNEKFNEIVEKHEEMGKKMEEEMREMYAEHEEMMAKMPDTKKMVEEALAKVPKDTADQIIEKINGADGTINRERIEGLEDEIKQLRKEIATKSASGGVRRVYQPYVDDFSAETNGSKKTFYLSREPLKSDTILVWGTDFPIILRPTTDFTIAGKALTLTSAVPAPSTGATLLVQYHA